MMGTQRAFLSPASSPANNGLHKYEQHINTQGGAQVSRDQITPRSARKLSLCTLAQSECEGRGQDEGRSPDSRCGEWSLSGDGEELRGCHHPASRQVYTCTVGPRGDMAGVKCEIFTRILSSV